jgi:hypothetical protein
MADADQPKSDEYPRSRTGELIREGKEVGKFWASLSSQQVIQLLFALGVTACGGVFVWQTINLMGQQAELAAARDRAQESESEKLRLHCEMQTEKLRTTFQTENKEGRAHQLAMEKERQRGDIERDKLRYQVDKEHDEKRMRFESDERAKTNAAVVSLGVSVGEMRKDLADIKELVKKWPAEFRPILSVAPMPKLKVSPDNH